MEEIEPVGLLHDIGKIAICEVILNKPGKLTKDEYEEIKRHPEIDYQVFNTENDMAEIAKLCSLIVKDGMEKVTRGPK